MCPRGLAGVPVKVIWYTGSCRGIVNLPRFRHHCVVGTTVFIEKNNTGATGIIVAVCADHAVTFVQVLDSKGVAVNIGGLVERK